jgi:hypothetical protein
MGEYEPVDLSDRCNAGNEALDGFPPIESGPRVYIGLPFLVAGAEDPERPRFILLEPGSGEVVMPIGRPAERVIVAHRRLPPPEEGPRPAVGDVVASYGFTLGGRDPVVVPIRERFEIGSIEKEGWDTDSPFLAAGAGTVELLDRHQGQWSEAGLRQTETPFRWGVGEVFLWAWENPDPGIPLEEVTLESQGARVLVAAITISNAGEHPFLRDAALPVRISMNGAERASRADELGVDVDRGVASYSYPLPAKDLFPGEKPCPGSGQAVPHP